MVDIKDTDSIVSFIDKTKANLMDFSRPEDLIILSKLIKKNVPWYRRKDFYSYVTYLLMSGDKPSYSVKRTNVDNKNLKNNNRAKQTNSGIKDATNDNNSLTLWVNYSPRTSEIGASFKAFISKTSGVDESNILSLGVKRYCSFVSFKDEVSLNKALKSLNGKTFEGRTIKVNIKNSDK